MKTKFIHLGIPLNYKLPNMTYIEALKIWVTNPNDDEYKIEYLYFEDGNPFPLIMQKQSHIAYQVNNIESCLGNGEVIVEPMSISSIVRIAFIIKDGIIFELYEEKQGT